jgi:hypothetical protein
LALDGDGDEAAKMMEKIDEEVSEIIVLIYYFDANDAVD